MLRRLLAALRNLLFRRGRDRELDAELAAFETLLADEQEARGATPAAARRAARLELGSRDAVAEAVRDVRAGSGLERLLRDLRHALRTLRRSPGFTGFTLLTFALAVGGVTLIVTLINAVLLKPLPYPESDRLVTLMEKGVHDAGRGFVASAPNFIDWERQDTLFQRLALYEYQGFNLSGDGDPEQVGGLRTTSGLFEVLGIPPELGRPLERSDDSLANGRVVVLGYALWRRRYGGDPLIVGRSIRLNGEPWQVVGVMPRGFMFTSRSQQVFVPIQLNQEDQNRASHSFLAVARLKDGVTVAAADAEMHTIGDRLRAEYPEANAEETATAFLLREQWIDDTADTLWALLIAVVLVLVIAAANVAGLLVARGHARQREMAARLALGGTRGRVMAELVLESVLLALGGALLGLTLAGFGVRQLLAILPQAVRSVPFRDMRAVSVDGTVALIALVTAIGAGLAAGVPAAMSVLPRDLAAILRDGASHGATSARGRRLRNALLTVEIALAVVVLAGAALLLASMRRLHEVSPGLDPANVTALQLDLPQPDFYGPAVRVTFCSDLGREVGAVPGVVAVSAVSHLPFSGANAGRSFVVEGKEDPGPGNLPSASWGVICPGYFGTMGIPLLAGRGFSDADRADAPPVVIFNRQAERRFFGEQSAVGRRIKLGHFTSNTPWMTVVGVVGDVHHSGLRDAVEPYLYAPYPQNAWPSMSVVVRTARGARAPEPALRQALRRAAPEQPVSGMERMEVVVEGSLGQVRFPMLLFTAFGAAAVLLAGLGVFGMAEQAVVQRRRELGIRMALGARAGEVRRLVLRQSLGPVGFGIAVGIGAALASARLLRGLLFGVTPTDPVSILAGALLLAAVAMIAVLWPVAQATRVDPALILRSDG